MIFIRYYGVYGAMMNLSCVALSTQHKWRATQILQISLDHSSYSFLGKLNMIVQHNTTRCLLMIVVLEYFSAYLTLDTFKPIFLNVCFSLTILYKLTLDWTHRGRAY